MLKNDPTIYLKRGQKYNFKNSMGAHPFQIRTAINGSAYNDGIVNNGVSNGTLTWDVQFDAPDILYYQCTAHAGMVGKIYIGNSGDTATIGSLNATGVSTFAGVTKVTNTTDTTSTTTGALIISGGVGIAKSLHVGQNITIGGTLTYEDVTNVDSIGLITARSGVNVTGGQIQVGGSIFL